MRVDSRSLWDTLYLVVLGAGIGVSALHVSLGLYHLALIAAVMAGMGLGIVAMERAPGLARLVFPELGLQGRVPAPAAPVALRVVSSQGACAWGYQAGDRWAIDGVGGVAPQLCQAAAAAIAPLLKAQPATGSAERLAACRCPLANRRVVFAVEAQAA